MNMGFLFIAHLLEFLLVGCIALESRAKINDSAAHCIFSFGLGVWFELCLPCVERVSCFFSMSSSEALTPKLICCFLSWFTGFHFMILEICALCELSCDLVLES